MSEFKTSRQTSPVSLVKQRRRVALLVLLLSSLAGWSVYDQLSASADGTTPGLETSEQGPDQDYSTFKHNSAKHASLGCTSCHQRTADNSIRPTFPGHPACQNCHTTQFVTEGTPMCLICHASVSGQKPPLKSFPQNFKESFNVKFDHAQHMNGAAKPKNGCQSCHAPANRGVALSIPANLNAHTGCYSCHTPNSKSSAGKEIASCGVCHQQRRYSRTSTNARAFRAEFSHAEHGARQKLECSSCHSMTVGAGQGRQVSSPRTAEHFPAGNQNCATCHNGKKDFGGDLAFKDCKRCHTGSTFRVPS